MALSTHQQKHIEAWQANGLMQVAYYSQRKLNSKTFPNWLRFYRSEQAATTAPTLIQVTPLSLLLSYTRNDHTSTSSQRSPTQPEKLHRKIR